jgi:hypothetical protein
MDQVVGEIGLCLGGTVTAGDAAFVGCGGGVCGAVPEIAPAAAIWRDLAVTPEAVAFDGIGFLREMAAGPPAAH